MSRVSTTPEASIGNVAAMTAAQERFSFTAPVEQPGEQEHTEG